MTASTLEIEMVEIARLKPAAYNPRRPLNEDEHRQLRKSLESWGAVNPAVVNDDNTLISAHQRVLIAAELGWTKFPCVRVSVTKTVEKQMNLALNKISGDWDQDKLAVLIAELSAQAEVDLEASGFAASELDVLAAKMLASAGLIDPDSIPEAPAEVTTRPGDIWVMGRHRLGCLDATNPDDVTRLLAGATPYLMVTDQPYGCSYDPTWRQREADKGGLAYAGRRMEPVPNDDRCDWREAWALSPSSVAYVWHGSLHGGRVQESLESTGFGLRSQIIWAKRHMVISRGHYHWKTEPLFYAVRTGATAQWIGDRRQNTLWDDISLDDNVPGGHSTQKPVECMARPMRNHRGDVYEPFVGTGTTIIAAQMEGRTCFAMDISPAFVDIARIRWEQFTGETATLEPLSSVEVVG